tara:strand:- start:357 stop:665 length:309 start_codon:yes stop_codon:yes gene_type:complete
MTAFDKAWGVVKRDGLDYDQEEIPEALAATYLTEIPPLKTQGRSQMKPGSRKSGGSSPRDIGRVSGAHASSSSRKDSMDHRKTQAEANVDAKLRNAGAKGQR